MVGHRLAGGDRGWRLGVPSGAAAGRAGQGAAPGTRREPAGLLRRPSRPFSQRKRPGRGRRGLQRGSPLPWQERSDVLRHARFPRVVNADAGKKFFLVYGRLIVIKHSFTNEYFTGGARGGCER